MLFVKERFVKIRKKSIAITSNSCVEKLTFLVKRLKIVENLITKGAQ